MIYYSCGDLKTKQECAELYSEWTGAKPQFRGMTFNNYLVVAKDSETGKIVGAAEFIIINDQFWNRYWALVENVYVAKAYRRQGIARGLMHLIESEAIGLGCEFVRLTSSNEKIAAHSLYRSLGYVEGHSFKKKLTTDSVWGNFGKDSSRYYDKMELDTASRQSTD